MSCPYAVTGLGLLGKYHGEGSHGRKRESNSNYKIFFVPSQKAPYGYVYAMHVRPRQNQTGAHFIHSSIIPTSLSKNCLQCNINLEMQLCCGFLDSRSFVRQKSRKYPRIRKAWTIFSSSALLFRKFSRREKDAYLYIRLVNMNAFPSNSDSFLG